MRILIREDGTQFLLQPYRERLVIKSTALLKREIFLLSQNYGVYSRIYKQPYGYYEGVFAHEPGYLLGETIWHYFGKPENLLYCEALSNDQMLIVVVRDNSVYLDTQIAKADLKEELSFFQEAKSKYTIYVYGDVPISEKENTHPIILPRERIKSFSRLKAPVFPSVPVQKELSLVPVETAVAELKLNRRAYVTTFSIAVIVLVGALWAWFTTQPAIVMEEAVSPYFRYVIALRTPDPGQQLVRMGKQMVLIYSSIPGWTPTVVSYLNGSSRFEMHSLGGSMTALHDWAAAYGAFLAVSPNGATLSVPIFVKARPVTPVLTSSQRTLAQLIDRMMRVLPDKTVTVASSITHSAYNETPVVLTLTNLSPEVLALVGQEITGLPINLSGCQFTISNGVLTGTVQLTLLGS